MQKLLLNNDTKCAKCEHTNDRISSQAVYLSFVFLYELFLTIICKVIIDFFSVSNSSNFITQQGKIPNNVIITLKLLWISWFGRTNGPKTTFY